MGNLVFSSNKSPTGILTGQLQSYCVACEIVGKNEDFEAHVLTAEHKRNLEECPLVEEYKLETIRKVPKGYLCERCNCLIRSITKVKIHVSTPSHTKTGIKQAPQIDIQKSLDGVLLAFGCVKIDDFAWNAIVKNTCLVCDSDVENAKAHSEDKDHVINLIQAPVERKHCNPYRKVDMSVQCLICNIVIPETELDKHLEGTDHKAFFVHACDGKVIKRKMPTLDINKCLRIKYYVSLNTDGDTGYCLICNWFIANDGIPDHINGYHHRSLLKLHNKWIEKKAKTRFIIEYNEPEDMSNKVIDAVSRNGNVEGSVNEKDDINNSENQSKYSTKSDPEKDVVPKPETEQEIVPKAGKIAKTELQNLSESFKTKTSDLPPKEDALAKNLKPAKAKNDKKSNEYKINTSINNSIAIPKRKENVEEEAASDVELEQAQALADEFNINFKPGGATTCSICNNRIGSTYKDIQAHITSVRHKKKHFKSSKISPNNYDTVRMQDYHNGSLLCYNIVQTNMVLNMQYCIDICSYQVFVNEHGQLQCYLCNKMVQNGHQHSTLDLHKQLWGNSLVVTSFDRELVREVKKGVFHCGFCNAIFGEWDALLEHLMSRSHAKHKIAAENMASLQVRTLLQSQMRHFV